ncbi:putative thioredoxin reductase [Colletotrichum tanaceti]|nr:putative thioredoxin reductase [Colletotrichum tanaceti]
MTSAQPQSTSLAELNRVFWEDISANVDTFWQQDWLKTLADQLTRFLRTQAPNLGLRPRDPANPVRLLDYACAYGGASWALAPFVDEILGIDVAPAIVGRFNDCAARLGYSPAQAHAVVGDLTAYGSLVAGAGFDVVIISMALHHLEDPKGMMELLARRVRPGGVLIAVEGVSAMETRSEAGDPDGDSHGRFGHEVLETTNRHVVYSKDLISGWFEEVGCDTERFLYIENAEVSHIPENIAGKPGGLNRRMFIAASVKSDTPCGFSLSILPRTTTNASVPMLHDVLIIGAGPAGLATATALSRQLYTSVLFDSGLYRNARATAMHNVLGFDHVPPAVFRAKAREDIKTRYAESVTFADVEVLKTSKVKEGLFSAEDAEGKTWLGRRLVLATGVTDIMPEIPGYGDCWGHGIFHCLFCHGFEERGAERVGVLAFGMTGNLKMATHIGHMARPLGGKVTIYTHGNSSLASEISAMDGNPFKLDTRRIAKMRMAGGGGGDEGEHPTGVTLTLDDGEEVTERFLAHAPFTKVNGPFAEQLGLEMAENGDVKTTPPFGETSVPGVYAVGDCGNMVKAVAPAMTSGALCAGGMVVPLQSEPRVGFGMEAEATEKSLG